MLDMRRLEVLQLVARTGSLSAAARELCFTQPAVSHHIARLEAEVGTPLIVRHARGVRLTEAGQALNHHAERLLARLQIAQDEVSHLAGLRAGTVRIAAFPSAAATLLTAAISALAREQPQLAVGFEEHEPPEATRAVTDGSCDLAVVFDYPEAPMLPDADLEQVELVSDPLRAVLPSGHPLAADERVALAELGEETWIAGCERCRAHLVFACAGEGFAPAIRFATDDYIATQRLVASGVGVSLLPELALAAARIDGTAVRALAAEHARRTFVLVPSGRRAPAVQATLDALLAAAGDPATRGAAVAA